MCMCSQCLLRAKGQRVSRPSGKTFQHHQQLPNHCRYHQSLPLAISRPKCVRELARSLSTPACTAAPTARRSPTRRARQPPQSVTPSLPSSYPPSSGSSSPATPPPPPLPHLRAALESWLGRGSFGHLSSSISVHRLHIMHTYIHMYMYNIYIYAYIYTYIHTYIHTCVCVCVCVCVFVCLFVCVCIHTQWFLQALGICVCECVRACIYHRAAV